MAQKKTLVQCQSKGAQTCLCREISYTMLSWSSWANIAQENYLCNVGPLSTNNFVQKNNLQFFLDLSGPTLHKKITSTMMTQSM